MMTDRATAAVRGQGTKPDAVRLAQRRAATALAELLSVGGPVASWTVGDLSPGVLRGRIRGAGDDALRTRHMRDWAEKLGESERWKPHPGGIRGELVVDAVFTGVDVQMWTPLAAKPNRAEDGRAAIAGRENGPAAGRVRRSQKLAAQVPAAPVQVRGGD